MSLVGFVLRGSAATGSHADCEARIHRAVSSAAAHHKRLLVKFGASWCGPCRELEKMLSSGTFVEAMGRYYDVVFIDYNEEFIRDINSGYYAKHKDLDVPGAKDWLKRHGLNQNMPEIAILDERGEVVVCSERPYNGARAWERFFAPPYHQTEVTVALRFFEEGNPAVTGKDLEKLRGVLLQKW